MSLRALALWGAFALAHALVAWLGWVLPAQPMGDVVLVYQPWSASALSGGAMVGITESWVYPHLALVPMLLTQLLALPFSTLLGVQGSYLVAWAVLVTIFDLLGFAVLVGRGARGRRAMAGWFWTAALALLGPIAMYRIDAITVPLAVAGGVWLAGRPAIAAALLTVGAWIKIWPGALIVAAVVAMRSRLRVVTAAAAVTAGVVCVVVLLGADRELFGFLTQQTGRGLQIEAVAATPFVWLALSGAASIEYSFEILTFQVRAAGADAVAAVLTPVMAVVVALIAAVAALRVRRGAPWQRLLPPLALALVTALIVTNKVGSPQFHTWLIAPVVLWLIHDHRRAAGAAALVLVLCALTFAVYPLSYDGLLRAQPLPVLLITVRNLLLVALLAHAVREVLRTPTRAHHKP
ncbi:glycosyltransferase 87 family protein [Microbacterium sp.]|uniref:glycosyltransferase 87 family protein n=1 Tax=Microbacterium sp. TaxID=51671 RepID=UPI0028127791|nr:glycosyltransferase 87 family protein [Microbacterium sp.]